MRITSGILKNRKLKSFNVDIRPTKESVREAVFSSIGGTCNNLHILDLFAGYGSFGLEAWSRGASSVTFVENQKILVNQLSKFIKDFEDKRLGVTQVIYADVCLWLQKNTCSYDLIFADPPYRLEGAFISTLTAIDKNSSLSENGCVIFELSYRENIELPEMWKIIKEKRYGKTKILMLKRN